jgi:hypothetical protein
MGERRLASRDTNASCRRFFACVTHWSSAIATLEWRAARSATPTQGNEHAEYAACERDETIRPRPSLQT